MYAHIVDGGLGRIIVLGVPATLIVSGMLMLESFLTRRPSKFLLLLGDASYSLYLIHPIAISAVAVVWEKFGLPSGSHRLAIVLIPVAVAFSLFVAICTYRWIEAPLLARLIYSQNGSLHPPSLPTEDLESAGVG